MSEATLSPTAKSEFRNQSGGTVGVIIIDNGKERALPVAPDASVMLTSQEQILTANAPASETDNPFTNGHLVLVTAAREMANRRPIGDPSTLPNAAEQTANAEQEAEAKAAADARAKADAERAAAEQERLEAATKQGQQGAQPRVRRPPAGPDSAGAKTTPPEETGTAAQVASDKGERAATEEVGTPGAQE